MLQKNNSKILYSLLIFGFILSESVLASTPQAVPFAGNWFYEAKTNILRESNACGENVASSYSLSYLSSRPEETAIAAIEDLLCQNDLCGSTCKIESSETSSIIPINFPDKNLWDLTVKEHGIETISYILSCNIPAFPGIPISFLSIAQPNYTSCANGGCLEVCTADMLGRNLDIAFPSLIVLLGHTGISIKVVSWDNHENEPYEYHVLEVLNESDNPQDKDVIQINTLNDFKSRNWYWGAGFNAIAKPGQDFYGDNLTATQASAVFEAGQEQMAFCQEYTLFPFLCHPGSNKKNSVYSEHKKEWISQLSQTCAKFRSDVFTNYAFKKGIDVVLPAPSRYSPYLIAPILTYNSFLQKRSLVSTHTYESTDDTPISDNTQFNENMKNTLARMTSKESIIYAINYYKNEGTDNQKFDTLMLAFAQLNSDKTLSAQERTDILLTAINHNKNDITLIELLTGNFISSNQNLSPQLDAVLMLYYHYPQPNIKNNLLRGLAVTYSKYLVEKSDAKSLQQVKTIQNIFLEVLKKPKNSEFLTTLNYLLTIFPYEQADQLLDGINEMSLSSAQKQQFARNYVLVALNYLKISPEKWNVYWKKNSSKQNYAYAQVLAAFLKSQAWEGSFDDTQKDILKAYLIQYWPASFKNENTIFPYAMRTWFTALANLSTNNPHLRKELIICSLTQHPNQLEVGLYIKQFSFDFKNSRSTSCYQDLLLKLETTENHENLTEQQLNLIASSRAILEGEEI